MIHPPGLTTGDVLRLERERTGVSQRAVCKALGISPTHLSDIEGNQRRPSEEIIEKLAKHYGIDPWELCLRDGRAPHALLLWLKCHSPEASVALRKMVEGA